MKRKGKSLYGSFPYKIYRQPYGIWYDCGICPENEGFSMCMSNPILYMKYYSINPEVDCKNLRLARQVVMRHMKTKHPFEYSVMTHKV